METHTGYQRQAFGMWLRTGRWPPPPEGHYEFKFNPYHDPRDGRFTFAPGGPRSLSHVVVSRRGNVGGHLESARTNREDAIHEAGRHELATPHSQDAVFRPNQSTERFAPVSTPSGGGGRGGNIRAFQDPMTLEQVFPALRDSPAGAILAPIDYFFNVTGPSRELTAELTRR